MAANPNNPLLAAFNPQAANPQQAGDNPLLAAYQNKKEGGAQAAATPPKMPFMAEKLDKYGMPYYGEGFQGFARKTFAKIFDPDKLLPKPTQDQARLMEAGQQQSEEILNKAGWDEWLEKWTGITGEEVTQSALALNLATKGTDEEGKAKEGVDLGQTISTAAGVVYRGGGQVISTGLEVLGVGDKISRKVQAFNVALDEIGDASSTLPDLSSYDTKLKKMFGDTPTTQRLGNILNAVTDIIPPVMAYNLIRAASAGQTLSQNVKAVKDNVRASNMIYTMYWDESKKDEYFRRVEAGENPDLVMRDVELPWVELAGSIAADPLTYSGLGIIGKFGKAKTPIKMFGKTLVNLPWETVARLPYFSEIFGLKNIGKARILSHGADWSEIASAETKKAFEALGKGGDETATVKALDTAINAVKRQFDDFADNYGFFSPDNAAKGELTKKTVGTFMHVLAQRFRNPDEILDTFKAFRNLKSGDNLTRIRAFSHMKEVFGALPFTNAGMQSMEFMTRVIDDVDIPAMLTKHGNDIPAFADEAFGKVNKLVEEFFPSVNDMAKAATEVKQLGIMASKRQKALAKGYEDLAKTRPSIIRANAINNVLRENKLYRGLQSFYSNTLLGMRPAYAVRNMLQNSVVIWHDLGFRAGLESLTTGAEVLVKSTVGRALKKDWGTQVVAREANKIKDILGFLPTQTLKGVGQAGREGFGFIPVSADVEKVHSVLITRYVVEQEMEKFLRHGGLPGVDGLGLPKEMAESLLAHSLETFGNVKETLKRFRADQATGFYETWRHLELDPKFKDTLRRSNLLDEMLDIRATAQNPVEFADRMDEFVKKIDDLARRTGDEPALVSQENPIAESVAIVERAFEEGGRKLMSEEELNQFRALVELRGQLRNQYQDYVDVMRDRIGRLVPPEQIRPFEEKFSALRNTLEQGNTKWRNYADEVYNGVYEQSKKGTPPAQLINQLKTVMLDVENGSPVLKKVSMADDFPNVDWNSITSTEFNGMMWKWFKDKQAAFWRGHTQDFVAGQDAILEELAKVAGVSIDEIRLAEFGASNPRLTQISQLTNQINEWESYLDYSSFARAQPRASEVNQLLESGEEATRAAKNVGTPPPVDQSITIESDVQGNPISYLQARGGVNIDEFSDIMGGARGKDKQGVMPGLFAKGGMGLDDAGRVLVEGGFILPEQADDLNFVRDFIRRPTGKTTTVTQQGAKLSDMDLRGVENWKGGKSHLFNAVNAERVKRGETAYSTIDDVPFEEAAKVLKGRTKPIPPYVEGTQPTVTRQLHENMNGGLRQALEEFRDTTLTRWGETAPMETKLDDFQEAALSKYADELDKRVLSARAATASIADATRDFILHDYNRTYADGFASMFTMFHYWPSRTYARWMERVVDGSGWAANYAKLRSTLERVNSDQPEFYRYNVQIGKLPGLNNDPFYFNLESTLNPMYSLTGVDFTDSKRRVDWLSSAVDDMGKFGFNLAMPLQWAMAMRLYNKQEDEAARRWLGRMVPVTQDLKAALNLAKERFGIDLMPNLGEFAPGAQYGEFDPFINAQGGFDAYEEKRIGRALSGMVQSGELSPEQAYDIMYKREGAEFDEAVHRAISERAPGQMTSYFMGVGFKSRTEGDLQVEKFYQQYYKLLAMRENIAPEEYRQALDTLLAPDGEFPFANTVLLAARGGDDRDAVYSYNVLSRIPPGDSTDILRGIGLSDELVQKFYNDKGDFSDWTPQDKERWMGAMLDLGATYSLPDSASRTEWNTAKDAYKVVQEEISEELGLPYEGDTRGVWDMVSTYYDMRDTNPEAAQIFKDANPEIDEAFGMLAEAKISDPLLSRYYVTLDTVESYYSGNIRAQLFEEFGKDIMLKQSEYYEKGYEGKAAQKAFLSQHPELKAYWSKKKSLEVGMNEAILRIASTLPENAPGAQLRADFVPENETQAQLAALAEQSGNVSWAEISQPMTDGLMNSLSAYVFGQQPLSKAANKEIEYLAKKYDYYNADDFIRAAAFALMLQQETAQPQQAQQPANPLLAAYQGQP